MSDLTELSANFKSTLPPRKRAKTKEEKEQRRIERILRNRKAAHASREKKRKHVEFLESYVLDLEKQLQLVNKLNTSLLSKYEGGDSEVDSMLNKINSLPDLRQMKLDHNLELDETLPKTPESFNSNSPKSSFEDDDVVPKLESRSSSISNDYDFTSPDFLDDSNTTNKFSLDIITGDSNYSNTIVVKQEQLPDPFNKKEDIFNEKVDLFDLQFNSSDNDFEFNELCNPAVITVSVACY